jgi:hypothetical protein
MATYAPARRLASLGAFALAFGVAGGSTESALAIGAIQSLPGCTANTAETNAAGPIAPGLRLRFGGVERPSLYVNRGSGTVTFAGPFPVARGVDLTTTGDAIIAPLLAAFDPRGAQSGEVTYGPATVGGDDAFCVLWNGVGYREEQDDKLNRVQLLLVSRSGDGDFDIVVNHDRVEWDSAAGRRGGPIASMGFSDGLGRSYVQPGSLTSGALLDANVFTGLIHNRHASTQPGRYVFEIREQQPPPPILTGTVRHGGAPSPNAPVRICPQGVVGPVCVVRQADQTGRYRAAGLTAGATYDLKAYPGVVAAHLGAATVTISATADTTQDLALTPAPPPTPDTTVGAHHHTAEGIPAVYWGSPFNVAQRGCPGGSAKFTLRNDENAVIFTGPMAEGPPGTYTVTVPATMPNHGGARFTIEVTCPTPADDKTVEGLLYIDPSGFVRETDGTPIPGATVTLSRSLLPSGPFIPVVDGSMLMSPSNRTNPDRTDGTGRFGWDVLAGYWRVRAQKTGCVSDADRTLPYVDSRIMEIPPPVTDLDLRMYCARRTRIHLRRERRPMPVRPDGRFVLPGAMLECAPRRPGCSASVVVRDRGRSPVALGAVRYPVGEGRLAPVRARLSPRGRRALARARRLDVAIAITIRKRTASARRTVTTTLTRAR